jgi:hypothetical protein
LKVRLRQFLVAVRRDDGRVEPDAGHALELPVRDPDRGQPAVPCAHACRRAMLTAAVSFRLLPSRRRRSPSAPARGWHRLHARLGPGGMAGAGTSGPVAIAYGFVHAQPDLSLVLVPLTNLVAACLAKSPADRPQLTQLMEAIRDGSAPRPADWQGSFWPEPVAGMVGSRQDSFRAQLPLSSGAALAGPMP